MMPTPYPHEAAKDVPEGARVLIGAFPGSLLVCPGRPGEVAVALRGPGALLLASVELERDGGDVQLLTRGAPWPAWLVRALAPELRLEVRVPARICLEVTTSGGHVEIRGVQGEVEVRGRAGHLVLHDIRGAIDGRTECGSIDVSTCRGEVDLTTVRGSIAVRDVEGRVAAHTRGGRISIADAVGELLLGSGGGPIEIAGVRAA